jgi:predicted phosphodiesterase
MIASDCRLALLGGIYSNYLALETALRDATSRGVDDIFCLGDLGAFGPHPDRVFPLLDAYQVKCVQGNYDDSVGRGLSDCQCGYTHPRDNHFAQISYDYTLANTSAANREYLKSLPRQQRLEICGRRLLLCHGSPRRTNEFLWESTSPDHFLEYLAQYCEADVIAGTHTGIKWQRQLSHGRQFVNVGVLGRPENDGQTNVWYTLLHVGERESSAQFIPIEYDHQLLAREMHDERLPDEFVETILTGWWTTCLEILPSKERKRGKY